ncbi:hypothetical protein E2C01_080643 [Portunus trituberculatus]|uniref:Uncharacterized protein n=1 Tax=Portunus trituberculatus TaxID=210409 RepID=A0A5B7ITS6_PORTR|nr:hypothetical protein [Portunus trituberculatus]
MEWVKVGGGGGEHDGENFSEFLSHVLDLEHDETLLAVEWVHLQLKVTLERERGLVLEHQRVFQATVSHVWR